jgi:non-homologous end joining protein Ku
MTAIALAEMPTRATTSFTLAWGLVSINVSAYTGVEQTRVVRHEYMDNGKGALIAVGRSPIRKDDGTVIDVASVVRYAAADNGELVILTDDEIAACTSPKGVAEIVSFVPAKNVGQYLTETQYQVRPKSSKGKVEPAADRAFALLTQAMKSRKVLALVKVALRGPARYALLDHDGTLTMIYTADAIRQARPGTSEYKFSKDELALAANLIDAVGVDAPTIVDDTAPVVQAFVNSKATGKVVAPVEAPLPTIDLAAALNASIDAAKAAKTKAAVKVANKALKGVA